MTSKKNTKLLWVVFVVFFILNFLQSYFTELLPDEAYYWVYSQHLDWGYFDHPPMVAFFIKISSFFFDNELGVRFFSNIAFLATCFLVWKTVKSDTKKDNLLLFLILFFSTALVNAYGFITTPDTGLVFFTALLLYSYKNYLHQKSWQTYIAIALAMAGMFYSKYQSFLVVVCIVASNPKILKDGRLWLSGLLTVILFLPHVLWQIENDFPSFRYHLYERVANRRYKFEYTLMHFVNMIAILGLAFPLFYKAFFKQLRAKNLFFKALVFIVFGFFALFLFSSFRGRVQAQWLVPISFSFIILTYHYFLDNTKSKKWLYGLTMLNFIGLLVARLFFSIPSLSPLQLDTHGNKQWVSILKSNYKEMPKFFVNSYQNAATYWFYANEKPYYYKNFTGRKNQFTLLQKEKSLSFDKVLLINRTRIKPYEKAYKSIGKDSIYTSIITNYQEASSIQFSWKTTKEILTLSNQNYIEGYIINTKNRVLNLDDFQFEVGFQHKKQGKILTLPLSISVEKNIIDKGAKTSVEFSFRIPMNTNLDNYNAIGIGAKSTSNMEIYRISDFRLFTFAP